MPISAFESSQWIPIVSKAALNECHVAFAIFIVIKGINKLKREEEAPPEEPTTKECPRCFSEISIKATRCGFCTSELEQA